MRWTIILLLFTGTVGCSKQPSGPKAVAPAPNGEQPSDETLVVPATNGAIKSPASVLERPQQLEWKSPAPCDLEIGAWLDKSGRVIWCAIRNPNSSPLEYNDYVLGYFESVKVLVRREGDSDWTRLEYRPKLRYFKSAGGRRSNIHVLKSGEEVPHSNATYSVLRTDDVQILKFGEEVPSAAIFPVADMSSENGYSFFVLLTEFEWPNHWSGDVDVIIRQHGVQLSGSSSAQNLPPLETVPISINLELVRASIP